MAAALMGTAYCPGIFWNELAIVEVKFYLKIYNKCTLMVGYVFVGKYTFPWNYKGVGNDGYTAPWFEFDMTEAPYNCLQNGVPGYAPTFYTFGIGPDSTVEFKIVVDELRTGNTGLKIECRPGYMGIPEYPGAAVLEATAEWPFILWAETLQDTIPGHWEDAAYFNKDSCRIKGDLTVDRSISASGNIHSAGTASSLRDTVKYYYQAGDPADSTIGYIKLFGPTGKPSTIYPTSTHWVDYPLPDNPYDDTLVTQRFLPRVSDSGVVKIIRGKGAVQITQSNDTTYVEGSAVGFGGGSYITAPGDKPPDSAAVSSFNDEFNFSTIDTTKWKWRNQGATTYLAAQQSFCVMRDTGTGATSNWRILEQTITDTTWSITVKISYASAAGAFNNVGLIAFNSTNGRLLDFGPAQDASYCYVQLNKYNSVTSYNSSGYSKTVNQNAGLTAYYRLRKDSAKNFYADLSQDGVVWSCVWSEAGSTFIESSGKVDRIGIGVNAYGSGIIAPGVFWFFRYNWTADFDPTTDN